MEDHLLKDHLLKRGTGQLLKNQEQDTFQTTKPLTRGSSTEQSTGEPSTRTFTKGSSTKYLLEDHQQDNY